MKGMHSKIGQRCKGLKEFGYTEADCSRNLIDTLLRSIEDKLRFSWSSCCAFVVGLVQGLFNCGLI